MTRSEIIAVLTQIVRDAEHQYQLEAIRILLDLLPADEDVKRSPRSKPPSA